MAKSSLKNITEQRLENLFFYSFVILFLYAAIRHIWGGTDFFMDTMEHIHASWLVSIGQVPYRDFFEHHHPLLWYLFAPVTQLFYRDARIMYIAKCFAVGGFVLVFYLFYRLALHYTKQKVAARVSLLILFTIPHLFNDLHNFRPDIFMYLFMILAIDYFFYFLDTKQDKYLCYSYFLWFIAFLFLQKAAAFALGFGVAQIYFIKTKIIGKNIFKALFFPLLFALLILGILYNNNLLGTWWNYNFSFNNILKQYYGTFSRGLEMLPVVAIIFVAMIIRTFKFSDKSFTIFCIWIFAILQLLIFAPHPWYYTFFFMLSSLLLAPVMVKWLQKKFILFVSMLLICLIISFSIFYNSANKSNKFYSIYKLVDYTLKNTSQDEPLLNAHTALNLFNPDINYYWFGFHNVVIIADLFLPKHFSYNEQIYKKPKFLFIEPMFWDKTAWINTRWLQDRNHALLQKASKGDKTALSKLTPISIDYWQIDMDFVKQNYRFVEKFVAIDLWQRIDEPSE